MPKTPKTQKKPAANAPQPITFAAGDVTDVPLIDLRPHPSNPKRHSPAQVDQIAASMIEWGWTVPIVADEDGVILAGHGRYLAAMQIGLAEAPVIRVRDWTEEQKRAYLIADNKITENGTWIKDILRDEVAQLDIGGFDIDLLGIDHTTLFGGYAGSRGNANGQGAPQAPQGGGQTGEAGQGAVSGVGDQDAADGASGDGGEGDGGGEADAAANARPSFTPNVNPEAQDSAVSDSDIANAAHDQSERFENVQKARDERAVTCTCPHCGKDFDVVL